MALTLQEATKKMSDILKTMWDITENKSPIDLSRIEDLLARVAHFDSFNHAATATIVKDAYNQGILAAKEFMQLKYDEWGFMEPWIEPDDLDELLVK